MKVTRWLNSVDQADHLVGDKTNRLVVYWLVFVVFEVAIEFQAVSMDSHKSDLDHACWSSAKNPVVGKS